MKQFLSNLVASLPKLPEADLKPFDSELKKLRAPDAAEAQRLARIADLEAQKSQAVADQAEAQRLSDIQALLPEFQEARQNWECTLEDMMLDLHHLISRYQRSYPEYQLACKLSNRLKALDGKNSEFTPPRAAPPRADYWLRHLLDNGTLTNIFREVRSQIEAEEAAEARGGE